MRRFLGLSLILGLGTAFDAEAQPRRGGRLLGVSTVAIAAHEDAAKLLELNDEQKTKIKALQEQAEQARRDLFANFQDLSPEERRERADKLMAENREREKKVAEICGAEKAKRLSQIALQVRGLGAAVRDEEVAGKLGITEDQQSKLQEIGQSLFEEFGQSLRDAGSPEDRAKIMAEMNKKMSEETEGVLTAEQKTKWKEMLGSPVAPEVLAKIRAGAAPRFGRRPQ